MLFAEEVESLDTGSWAILLSSPQVSSCLTPTAHVILLTERNCTAVCNLIKRLPFTFSSLAAEKVLRKGFERVAACPTRRYDLRCHTLKRSAHRDCLLQAEEIPAYSYDASARLNYSLADLDSAFAVGETVESKAFSNQSSEVALSEVSKVADLTLLPKAQFYGEASQSRVTASTPILSREL